MLLMAHGDICPPLEAALLKDISNNAAVRASEERYTTLIESRRNGDCKWCGKTQNASLINELPAKISPKPSVHQAPSTAFCG